MDKSFLNKRKRPRSLAIALAKCKEKPVPEINSGQALNPGLQRSSAGLFQESAR